MAYGTSRQLGTYEFGFKGMYGWKGGFAVLAKRIGRGLGCLSNSNTVAMKGRKWKKQTVNLVEESLEKNLLYALI